MTSQKLYLPQILVVILSTIACVLVVDFLAFYTIPKAYTEFAWHYRAEIAPHDAIAENTALPIRLRNYYLADDALGFDIKPNVSPRVFSFADHSTRIFSNELGCYDRRSASDLPKSYDYFAGDSFTWGFASYNQKFPVIYEKESGRAALKCGVSNTGQAHQFEKFKNTVSKIGRYPETVFVGFFANDPADDLAHPHTTVIDGLSISSVVYEKNQKQFTKRSIDDMRASINRNIGEVRNSQTLLGTGSKLKLQIRRYSLTANLVNVLRKKILVSLGRFPHAGINLLQQHYSIESDYRNNTYTENNRAVIKKWALDSRVNGYNIVFVVIPSKSDALRPDFARDFLAFLKDQNINYLDVQAAFEKSPEDPRSLYWFHDGHLNNKGNFFLGDLIANKQSIAALRGLNPYAP